MRHTATFATFAVAFAIVPALACADGEESTVVKGGLGFPIGTKSRIHTNFETSAGFDSNPIRQVGAAATEKSDWKAQFRPMINVDIPGESLTFGLQSMLLIEQLFGTQGNATTHFGGHIGLNLGLGSEESVVGFELSDTLSRTPTFFQELGQGILAVRGDGQDHPLAPRRVNHRLMQQRSASRSRFPQHKQMIIRLHHAKAKTRSHFRPLLSDPG